MKGLGVSEGWMEVKGRSLKLEELGDGRKRVREGGREEGEVRVIRAVR